MEPERLLKVIVNTPPSIYTIGMILSNNIDTFSSYGGLISDKMFNKVSQEILDYIYEHNSFYAHD